MRSASRRCRSSSTGSAPSGASTPAWSCRMLSRTGPADAVDHGQRRGGRRQRREDATAQDDARRRRRSCASGQRRRPGRLQALERGAQGGQAQMGASRVDRGPGVQRQLAQAIEARRRGRPASVDQRSTASASLVVVEQLGRQQAGRGDDGVARSRRRGRPACASRRRPRSRCRRRGRPAAPPARPSRHAGRTRPSAAAGSPRSTRCDADLLCGRRAASTPRSAGPGRARAARRGGSSGMPSGRSAKGPQAMTARSSRKRASEPTRGHRR